MKFAAGRGLRCWAGVAALVLAAGWASSVRAELDYEFAQALMQRDEPSFPTEDMVEVLIAKLQANPATKSEAALISAALKRKQARTASVGKRKELVDQAEALYTQVLNGEKGFRLYAVAEKEKEALSSEKTRVLKAVAEQEKDPAKRREICTELAKQMAASAEPFKTTADAEKPIFDAAYKKLQEWNEKHTDQESGEVKPPAGHDLMDPLEKHFDAWIGADRRYVATKVEELECYDDSDPAKKTLATTLAKLCEERSNNEVLTDFFPVIAAWYNYMLGRTYAAVQDVDKSTEAWKTALDVDPSALSDDLRKAMFGLKKLILVDLVKMKMRGKKYGDVESIVLAAVLDVNLKKFFEEDAGKDLLVDYAKALTLQAEAGAGDYEKALGKLRESIDKEEAGSKGASTIWANQFARVMAEILQDARRKNIHVRLPADAWYQAAHGFFLLGQNEYRIFTEAEKNSPEAKAQFEKAYAQYQDAVEYYRRAIGMCRSDKTELPTRIEVEPKSWFEMGIAFVKMKSYFEAVAAFQALRNTFSDVNRKRWLPDPAKPENRRIYTKAFNESLAELDKNYIAKSLNNINVALDQGGQVHKDLWYRKWKTEVLTSESNPEEVRDLVYVKARNAMDEAKAMADAGKGDPNPKTAEDSLTKALNKYVQAGDLFTSVPANSEAYEAATYQAGSCYTLAQELLASGRLPSKKYEEAAKQAKDLAGKALTSYAKYTDYTVKHPLGKDAEDTDRKRRQDLEGAVLLARSKLHAGALEWDKAVECADKYIDWEQHLDTPPAASGISTALVFKFYGNIELTGKNFAPACDPYLKGAEAAMREMRKLKPKDNKTYVAMLNLLSRRYNMAAFQADKFIEDKKLKPGSEDWYENKVAELQSIRVDLQDDDPNSEPALEDYSRLVYLFNKTGQYEKAVDQADRLLKKFDPKNQNVRIPDEPKVWQALLARMIGDQEANMVGLITYNDLNKEERCKRDHATLIDYMYDTREGRAATEAARRPAYDKFNMDMERALKQLATIKKNYPDCQTLPDAQSQKPLTAAVSAVTAWVNQFKGQFPEMADLLKGEPKAPLALVEEEIDFRRKIAAARDLLSSLALDVAEAKAKAGDPEGAKKYRELAGDQIKVLLAWNGETPQMKIKLAEINISNGKYDEALDTLMQVKTSVDKETQWGLYFEASRKLSEVLAKQGNWKEAVGFPEGIAIMAGFKSKLVKERWPGMCHFLEDCYKHGAKCPPQLAAQIDEVNKEEQAREQEMKRDALPGDAKTDPDAKAPDAQAPAAQTPAAPAPKKDETATPKKDEPKAGEKPAPADAPPAK